MGRLAGRSERPLFGALRPYWDRLGGPLWVDLTCSPHRLAMTANCAELPLTVGRARES
jgi:hypothetical protein